MVLFWAGSTGFVITVVVSALNEELRLPDTLNKIIRSANRAGNVALDVIVVNDGSTDGTAEVIKTFESRFPFIRSIHFPENRGIGEGIRAAVQIAKGDRLCNFPGDNACSAYIMETMFSNAYKADFLISYIVNSEDRGKKRHLISALYSLIYLVTFYVPLKYVNGSPMYPVALLKNLRLKSTRYSILAEASIKMMKKPITFLEIPDYVKPNQVKSSALKFKNILEVILNYMRLVWEIKIWNRSEYAHTAKRVLPPLTDLDLEERRREEAAILAAPSPVLSPESERV